MYFISLSIGVLSKDSSGRQTVHNLKRGYEKTTGGLTAYSLKIYNSLIFKSHPHRRQLNRDRGRELESRNCRRPINHSLNLQI